MTMKRFRLVLRRPGAVQIYVPCHGHRQLSRVIAGQVAVFNEDIVEEVIIATGITPRVPAIEGIDHPNVLTYVDVIVNKKPVGQRVAIIGAGGIGFDTAEYITHDGESTSQNIPAFMQGSLMPVPIKLMM